MALRHEKRVLQKAEIALGREGTAQAVNFPEVRDEIVALKKLEQEQREVTLRIAQIEEGQKQIEEQRETNADEQNTALAELEEGKKPLIERRDEAKGAADLCNRELAEVERRLQENDAADRQLLQKLTDLQAQVPPPEDRDAQVEAISTRRAHLPEQRAEVVRARLGSVEACRQATDKLALEQNQLDEIDKRIAQVRSDFEARDRALNESSRAYQEALKEAKTRHQSVEERKNPAYLNIGRHLATRGIAPPNAPHLLEEVQRHRAAVDRHSQHKEELAVLSGAIDKQELRKFYFSVLSVIALLAIGLWILFQTPGKREWLPHETEAILSINTEQLQRDGMLKRWRNEQTEEWQTIWSGLTAEAQRTPVLNLSRDTVRVTRAMTTDTAGAIREFVLVQAKGDVTPLVRSIEQEQGYERRPISGLPIWSRSDFAFARLGPRTVAVGAPSEVEELVRVRLGIDPDLKITGSLFDRFNALDQQTALRLISSDPPSLARFFVPIFAPELLEAAQIFGLSLAFDDPVKGRMIVKAKSTQAAADLARHLREEPQRWLRLQDSDLLFYVQPPEVITQDTDIELRFNVPENTARLFLHRVAKGNTPSTLVER